MRAKSYSVAIRTLGKSPDVLKLELQSIHAQTTLPDKITVYIADGYPIPDFRVGYEQYEYVRKGMLSQRALQYDNIDSEYLLLLDDDVCLQKDSVAKLLRVIEHEAANCVACDTYANHTMPLFSKLKNAFAKLVYPHLNQNWAFKIHGNGSFSYINKPVKDYYPSMSAAGPAALWRLDAFRKIHLEDERWIDSLDFAYNEDTLQFYKLYLNQGKLFVSFNSGVVNLDAKSSSQTHHKSIGKYYTIGKANYILWHRIIYSTTAGKLPRLYKSVSYGFKTLWTTAILSLLSINKKFRGSASNYIRGTIEGRSFTNSAEYKSIPSFIIKQ